MAGQHPAADHELAVAVGLRAVGRSSRRPVTGRTKLTPTQTSAMP